MWLRTGPVWCFGAPWQRPRLRPIRHFFFMNIKCIYNANTCKETHLVCDCEFSIYHSKFIIEDTILSLRTQLEYHLEWNFLQKVTWIVYKFPLIINNHSKHGGKMVNFICSLRWKIPIDLTNLDTKLQMA